MGKHEGGSIERLGRGKWRVTVSTGWNPRTRKYGKIKRTVSGTKNDAIKVRDELNRMRDGGVDFELGRQTFREFATDWHRKRMNSGEFAPGTIQNDKTKLNTIFRYIGDAQLNRLTPKALSDALDAMHSELQWNGTTWRLYFMFVKQILKSAERLGAIDRNPMDRLDSPRKEKSDRHAISAVELRRLVEKLDESDSLNASRDTAAAAVERSRLLGVRIIAYTGLRRGEMLGLEWRDFDRDSRIIRVRRQVAPVGGVRKPKTEGSVRQVPIPQALVEALEVWRLAQHLAAESAGAIGPGGELPNDAPIVMGAGFSHCSSGAYGLWWRNWADSHGFEGLKLHELRHTQATLLVADGVDVKTVADRLGHSNVSTTLDNYTHSTDKGSRKAAEDIESIIMGA